MKIRYHFNICTAATVFAVLLSHFVPSQAEFLNTEGSENYKVQQKQLRASHNEEEDRMHTRRLQASCDTAFVYCEGYDLKFCPYVTSKWGNSINHMGALLEGCKIFAGRGQCDPNKGYQVGTATININEITLNTRDFHYFIDVVHVIKGVCPSDKNNGILKSPGLWSMNLEEDVVSTSININNKNGTRIFPLNGQTCLTIHMNVCPRITEAPSSAPSLAPSSAPSSAPSLAPSSAPSSSPTSYDCDHRPACPPGEVKLQEPDEDNKCCTSVCCDACPENTICRTSELDATRCTCIKCDCGFCTSDGTTCCDSNANGVNCKAREGLGNSNQQCLFQKGNFPAFEDSSGNACSGVENNEHATENGCGCKPNESTTCTFDSNPADNPCFICREEDLDVTCDTVGSHYSCAECKVCMDDCEANPSPDCKAKCEVDCYKTPCSSP